MLDCVNTKHKQHLQSQSAAALRPLRDESSGGRPPPPGPGSGCRAGGLEEVHARVLPAGHGDAATRQQRQEAGGLQHHGLSTWRGRNFSELDTAKLGPDPGAVTHSRAR